MSGVQVLSDSYDMRRLHVDALEDRRRKRKRLQKQAKEREELKRKERDFSLQEQKRFLEKSLVKPQTRMRITKRCMGRSGAPSSAVPKVASAAGRRERYLRCR